MALLPFALSWILVLLLAYLLADFTWKLVGTWTETNTSNSDQTASALRHNQPDAPAASDIVWNQYHLFGKEPAPGAAPAKPVEPRRKAPVKPVRITLYGTLAATNPEDAMAVLSAGGKPAEIYRPGDELQAGVVLESVGPWSVVVMVGDQQQLVPLVEESKITRTVRTPRVSGLSPEAAENSNEKRLTEPEVVAKITEYRQALASNPMALANKIRAYAVRRDGEIYGYRLRPGTDRALLGQMGLRSGDILVSLNGMAVNEATNLPDIMANLKDQPEILMELERGGKRQELRVVMGAAE